MNMPVPQEAHGTSLVVSRAVSLLTALVLVALLGLAAPDLCAAQSVSGPEREALVRLRVDQGGRTEDADALIRLAERRPRRDRRPDR
jgi:hypothetical protein